MPEVPARRRVPGRSIGKECQPEFRPRPSGGNHADDGGVVELAQGLAPAGEALGELDACAPPGPERLVSAIALPRGISTGAKANLARQIDQHFALGVSLIRRVPLCRCASAIVSAGRPATALIIRLPAGASSYHAVLFDVLGVPPWAHHRRKRPSSDTRRAVALTYSQAGPSLQASRHRVFDSVVRLRTGLQSAHHQLGQAHHLHVELIVLVQL